MASLPPSGVKRKNTVDLYTPQQNTRRAELTKAYKNELKWVCAETNDKASLYLTAIGNMSAGSILYKNASIAAVRDFISTGIEKAWYNRLKSVLSLPDKQIADVLRISTRTLSRKEVFSPDESEKTLRLAATFQKSLETFQDIGTAREWFTSPKQALGGKTPFEFCDTELGAEEVRNLLGRIEHGVFS